MIDYKDISVVVQGAIIQNETKKCLNSVREYLPGAEIILSTWEGSDISGLDYDILIENTDPGAVHFEGARLNNVNRQLVSTKNGLKTVKRKYTLKLRTDFYLRGSKFLTYWDKFPYSDIKWKSFNHRVIICTVFSRIFSDFTDIPMPFHPSDFFFFGETEDIKNFFINTELMQEKDMAQYTCLYPDKIPYHGMTWRFGPEQYYCLSYVKQKFNDIKMEDWTDWNSVNVKQSHDFMINNFIFLGPKESEIFSDKHCGALNSDSRIRGIMNYNIFLDEYKKAVSISFSNP